MQLYSQGTPNGVKITLMLEELLALGHEGAEYDAWLCRINKGEQFSSGFVEINPNSKIPALLDQSNGKEQRVLGIVASKLLEIFNKPVIVLSFINSMGITTQKKLSNLFTNL